MSAPRRVATLWALACSGIRSDSDPPQPPLIQQVHPGVTYEDCVERCKKCGPGKTRTVSRISAQAIRTENEVRRLCLSSVHHTIRPLLFRFWPLVDLANFPKRPLCLAKQKSIDRHGPESGHLSTMRTLINSKSRGSRSRRPR